MPGETKLDPWKSFEVENYERLEKEFGIKPMKDFVKQLPDNLLLRRGLIFGHRDFGLIADAHKKKKPFVMLTGLMPSGKFHLGHALVGRQIMFYQELGAEVKLLVADIEAYNMRGLQMEEMRKIALEEYLLNFIALGLKPKNLDYYFQSDRGPDAKKSNAYYRLIGQLARRPTFNEMQAIYGELSPAKIQSVLFQMSDILHPQLPEFGGPKPVVVPVGVDQDPHIRLSRDLAARMPEYKFLPPSATFHKFMKGLKGGKMSSSDETSFIALTEDPEAVAKKVNKYAFSGGKATVEEHRKLGGDPSVDVAYNMLYFMFEPDDAKVKKLHDDYVSGKLLSGELKAYLIERLQKFLYEHQEKREKAKDKLADYLPGHGLK